MDESMWLDVLMTSSIALKIVVDGSSAKGLLAQGLEKPPETISDR